MRESNWWEKKRFEKNSRDSIIDGEEECFKAGLKGAHEDFGVIVAFKPCLHSYLSALVNFNWILVSSAVNADIYIYYLTGLEGED